MKIIHICIRPSFAIPQILATSSAPEFGVAQKHKHRVGWCRGDGIGPFDIYEFIYIFSAFVEAQGIDGGGTEGLGQRVTEAFEKGLTVSAAPAFLRTYSLWDAERWDAAWQLLLGSCWLMRRERIR
jgi:hypothetical protein